MNLLVFIGIHSLFFVSCSINKPVSDLNLAQIYARNPSVAVSFSRAASSEDYHIFCGFSFGQPEISPASPAFWGKYKLEYQVRVSFESSRVLFRDTLGPESWIKGTDPEPVFQVTVPAKYFSEDRVLLLKVGLRNASEVYFFTCLMPGEENPACTPMALFRANGRTPVTGNLARSGDTLCIRNFDFRSTSPKLEFIPFSSSVALPPMAGAALSDSSAEPFYPVTIRINEPMVFREPGYYRVFDELRNRGFGFLVGSGDFPSITRASELAASLVYISTRDERRALSQEGNTKAAVDQFWLKVSPVKDRARELIKKYYLNAEAANRLFSSDKEGWKTDRGMVMSIFGPPVQVFRTRDTEVWVYDKSQNPESAVFYFFRKASSNFSDIWELKRLSDYDKIWYGVVDLWRKGLIDR